MANFDAAKAIFNQVDANSDGNIDPNEFRNWIASNANLGGASSIGYESSSFQSSAIGANAASTGFSFDNGANFEEAATYGTAYSSQSGFESTGGVALSAANNSSSATFLASSQAAQAGTAVAVESGSVQQSTEYAAANGIYQDPNPQIIRRAAVGGPVTYQQKILVRFLQPPPVPPPGPLIIKEVRPPQPPPPPPLVVRQKAPPLPQPPPLILRERPPVPPAAVASQTVIRRLPPIPVPPRSVIIERLPPLPPKPRDIIIERWVPYGAQAKRRTIVQRAAAAKEYPKPRNIIIVYDAVQARVVRQFQRLGVVQENPQAYISRYGASLLDSNLLVQQARAAGVIEDISAPAVAAVSQFSASSVGGNAGFEASSASTFNQSSASTSEVNGFGGLQVVGGAQTGTYGLSVAGDALEGAAYESQSFSSSSNAGGVAAFDVAAAAFNSADTNRDGKLDRAEFQRFVQGGL